MYFQNYYYIIIGLQIFCGIHSYRRGTLNRWIFLIAFLPLIGSLYYLFSEVLSNKSSFRAINKPAIDIGATINPGGRIKKLEEELQFTNTFANKVKLADAYLAAGQTDKAIDLYRSSLTGAFDENEHVMAQLIIAYYAQQRYEEVIPLAKKLYKLPQFARSKAHLLYAQSLENLGKIDEAEAEFKAMKGRYSYFEQRYEYGLFLMRQERDDDARQIFTDILAEEPHLGSVEKKSNRVWLSKAKEELRKITPTQKAV
ncbi:tetratricopeptide repeat protein [uncultured Mucilaginibacter sp.]|uniref:tetratricopeptide repeat protein n=1 Tax=uncultured Mucilaginibacter sp. TaxID=797541 RepID=UPI0025DA025C|nr:tetratricopeptide repeat protein [uncultured Mucilaginibacter sp.]